MTGSKPQEDLVGILYQALASPIGLLLQTDDPKWATEKLRSTRASCQDEALEVLAFRLVDLPDGNLVIYKRAPKPAAPEMPNDLMD